MTLRAKKMVALQIAGGRCFWLVTDPFWFPFYCRPFIRGGFVGLYWSAGAHWGLHYWDLCLPEYDDLLHMRWFWAGWVAVCSAAISSVFWS